MSRVYSNPKEPQNKKAASSKSTTQPFTAAQDNTRVVAPYHATPPPLLLSQKPAANLEASHKPESTAGSEVQMVPGVELKKEFPGRRLPSVYTPLFTVKSSVSLTCSIAARPKEGPFEGVTLSKEEVSVEMGKLAGSFSLSSFGKGPKDVSFSSTFPGVGKLSSQSISINLPAGVTWSSKLNLTPKTFDRFTVSGDITVQLKLTITPNQPPPPPRHVPVVNLSPWQQMVLKYGAAGATALIAADILGAIVATAAKFATAPFVIVAPEIFGLDQGIGDNKKMML